MRAGDTIPVVSLYKYLGNNKLTNPINYIQIKCKKASISLNSSQKINGAPTHRPPQCSLCVLLVFLFCKYVWIVFTYPVKVMPTT